MRQRLVVGAFAEAKNQSLSLSRRIHHSKSREGQPRNIIVVRLMPYISRVKWDHQILEPLGRNVVVLYCKKMFVFLHCAKFGKREAGDRRVIIALPFFIIRIEFETTLCM